MALLRIDKMKKIEKSRTCVHGEVTAAYSTFVQDGTRYFQIETYGAPDHACPGQGEPDCAVR